MSNNNLILAALGLGAVYLFTQKKGQTATSTQPKASSATSFDSLLGKAPNASAAAQKTSSSAAGGILPLLGSFANGKGGATADGSVNVAGLFDLAVKGVNAIGKGVKNLVTPGPSAAAKADFADLVSSTSNPITSSNAPSRAADAALGNDNATFLFDKSTGYDFPADNQSGFGNINFDSGGFNLGDSGGSFA